MRLKMESQRLTLRPFNEADARRIAYLAGDYDVAKMCGRVPHPYRMTDAYEFVSIMERGRAAGHEFAFAITAPIDGLVGACGVLRVGEEGSRAYELGYWLGTPYWGLGYASEAGRMLMDWARTELGAETFVAGHYIDNPASGHVLRKLGFAATGTQELFGLARQRASLAQRYVWPEGAPEVSLPDHHAAHQLH